MYDLDLLEDREIGDVAPDRGEVDPQERLMAAALLTATAFRMKDTEGLVLALRQLVAAVGDATNLGH